MTKISHCPTLDEEDHGKCDLTAQEAILHPKRLGALDACDTPVYSYHRYSLLQDFFRQWGGRNVGMLAMPLLLLLLWSILWQLIFLYADENGDLREAIGSWGDLVSPLWVPISFLMVFRLARAAIRFWDSRLSVFPIALKNFLRTRMDAKNCGLDNDSLDAHRLDEVAFLLDADEARMLMTANHPVLLVLDRLRELAYDVCLVSNLNMHPAAATELYKQINTHLDSLSGAFGAMERICGTPLPFVYVSQLCFVCIFICVARDGWAALVVLVAINWAMLGLEAASVECERPFGWSSNHLPLAKFCIVIGQNIAQTLDETELDSRSMFPQ
ncbi:hypothetical protein ACHAWF_017731 [Thalassiosira exigua]